ncbi:MAG: 50S ribosomal protein L10 [Thermoguttaceae bacterium]|jgi:ribosomal protein L10|nr:50S ribosomal protein L10 [Thermoguttaceae bacterium]
MSKYVKNLITEDLRKRLADVHDAVLVSVVGLDANADNSLRAELSSKDINLLVVKKSLAARATEGTPLAPMFDGVAGSAAICWGGQDIVALAKEVVRLAKKDEYKAFEARGGVLDGDPLTAGQVEQVSKWPTREEQLSILMGQVLAPGARLASQLISIGGALASQIEQKGKEEEN